MAWAVLAPGGGLPFWATCWNGQTELSLHAAVADHPALAQVSVVHCVGPRMRALWDRLPRAKRGASGWRPQTNSCPRAESGRWGDVVLVKGSRGQGQPRG